MKGIKRSRLVGMNQHYRRYGFEEYLDSMARCGIKNLELWCGAPHFMLDSEKYSNPCHYRDMAQRRGLSFVSVCAPSMMWQYHFGCDGDEYTKKTVAYYQNGVRVAAELGCKIMSVNAGWGYWDENPKESQKRSLDAIRQVADLAQKEGVLLALETLQPVESNIVLTLEEAEAFYRELNHPAVKMMIDTVAVGVAKEKVDDWFKLFGKDIVHCHLIDGTPSGHRVFGDGEYPLLQLLRSFEENDYEGYFTMELGGTYASVPFEADVRNLRTLYRVISD